MNDTAEDTVAPTEAEVATAEANEDAINAALDAADVIKNHVIAAMAVGLVPIPGVDMAGTVAIQVRMVNQICEIYGVTLKDNAAKAIVLSLAGGVLPATLANGFVSGLKIIPGLGSLTGAEDFGRDNRLDGRRDQGVGDLDQGPGSVERAADDLIERPGKSGGGCERFLERQALEEKDSEVVDVTLAALLADFFGEEFGVGDALADAIAAKLDGFADGEDAGGLDVLVGECGVVQRSEGLGDGEGDLEGLVEGEGALAENIGEAGVGRFHQGVGEGDAVVRGGAKAPESDEVGLG
jgi:hypothetical protein